MKSKIVLERDVEVTSSSPDDPRLKKRWGYIAALPSEYLIHFRDGILDEKTSGQGGSCFKRLRDTTFIIPTSLKEVIFEAYQLTQDNVDVRIRGMTVYRISDPMRIYKLINFLHRQSAEEKLARMIGDMCRSNAKWLVANMNVSECIRKRKEDIADALKKEVSRVVSHEQTGWGVEIVTIDIQDVYIQDQEIFNALQMMFKTEKLRESKLAEMTLERDLEMKQLEQERELTEHRKNTDVNKARTEAEIQIERMEIQKNGEVRKLTQEREIAEHKKTNELDKARIEAEIQNQKLDIRKNIEVSRLEKELEIFGHQKDSDLAKAIKDAEIKDENIRLARRNEEKQFELDRYRVEQNEAIAHYKLSQQAERDRQQMQLAFEKSQKEVESQQLIHLEELSALKERIRAENATSLVNLEKQFIREALPSVAEAIAKSMKDVKIHIFQQDGGGKCTPFNFILAEVLDIFRDRMDALQKNDAIKEEQNHREEVEG